MHRCIAAPALLAVSLVMMAGVATPAHADIAQFFTSPVAFHNQTAQSGKNLKGLEDFEYAQVAQQAKLPFPNSLQNGVPAPGLPNGIQSDNLIIQTNITPTPCPASLNPSTNQSALWINGAGFIGSNSIKIGTDEFLYNLFSSLDLIFTSGDKTGIGVDVSTYNGFNMGHQGFIICAYDTANTPLGSFLLPAGAPEPNKNFIGIWSPVPIGRVNIWGIFDVPQPFAVDNIEMWTIPAPSAACVLVCGALTQLRRRRRA